MPLGNDSPLPLHDDITKRFANRGWEMDFYKALSWGSRSAPTIYDFNQVAQSGAQYGLWTVAATSTATTWAALAEPGGWLRGVTGASVATAAVQLYGNTKFWNGTAGAGFASRIRLSAVTDIRVEMGFVDVAPAAAVHVVNVASASFNSVTTGAVYMFDNGTAASTTLTRLYSIGVSTAIQSVTTTTNQYASGTSMFVMMEIDGTTVKLWLGNPAGGPTAVLHSAFAAAESWIPFLGIKGLGASKNVDVDYLATWTLSRV